MSLFPLHGGSGQNVIRHNSWRPPACDSGTIGAIASVLLSTYAAMLSIFTTTPAT
jgi:hypothetical protein